jgi:hypothetical protein
MSEKREVIYGRYILHQYMCRNKKQQTDTVDMEDAEAGAVTCRHFSEGDLIFLGL